MVSRSFTTSSSKSAAPIGSRPEVGSSRKTMSGSRARARASAARLIMPPDSSDGNLRPASGGSPTNSTLSIASSSISGLGRSRYSRIGTCTFSSTVSAENSAPCWNRTPRRMSMRSRSASSALSTSTPNSLIVPDCFLLSPSMVRSSTDLPEPEAPTKPRISPRRMLNDRPSSITLSPNATVTSRAESTMSCASSCCTFSAASCVMSEVDCSVEDCEQAIEYDDDEDGLHHRGGYVPTERFGAAADLHAFDRGNDTDDHGHERRLDQAGKNAAQVDGGAQPVDECGGRNIRIEPRGHHASAKCGKICDDGEARQADDQRNQARKDQHADRVQADYLQRIDLLAHLHRADLSGNGTAGPAGNHDRGQKHAQFPQDQDADEIDDEYVGTEIPKLIGPLLRDDGPDDARHQHHDGYGPNAHAVDLVEDRGGIYGMPPPQFHLRAADGGPQYVHGSEEIVAHLVHLPPDRLEPTQHDVGLRWARRVLFSACRVAH